MEGPPPASSGASDAQYARLFRVSWINFKHWAWFSCLIVHMSCAELDARPALRSKQLWYDGAAEPFQALKRLGCAKTNCWTI